MKNYDIYKKLTDWTGKPVTETTDEREFCIDNCSECKYSNFEKCPRQMLIEANKQIDTREDNTNEILFEKNDRIIATELEVDRYCRKIDGTLKRCRECLYSQFKTCPREILSQIEETKKEGDFIDVKIAIKKINEKKDEKIKREEVNWTELKKSIEHKMENFKNDEKKLKKFKKMENLMKLLEWVKGSYKRLIVAVVLIATLVAATMILQGCNVLKSKGNVSWELEAKKAQQKLDSIIAENTRIPKKIDAIYNIKSEARKYSGIFKQNNQTELLNSNNNKPKGEPKIAGLWGNNTSEKNYEKIREHIPMGGQRGDNRRSSNEPNQE